MIEVFRAEKQRQVIALLHVCGVCEEEVGVGLQMNRAAVLQEAAVALHEVGRGETLARILHLRIAEREPDLLHLAFSEEAVYNLYVRAQKRHVLKSFAERLRSAGPHACALNVYANEVDVGEHLRQPHRILAFAAAQLEHNRVVVLEIHLAPMSLHVERHIIGYRERILKHVLVSLHIGELRQFSFAHYSLLIHFGKKYF